MLTDHLSQAKVSSLIGFGIFYWGVAATKIRYGGHVFYANDLQRIGTFIGTVPLGYAMIRFTEKVLSISPRQRLASTAIMSSAALFLDGIAFMWFPTLYENPSLTEKNPSLSMSFSRMGAAWILYGVGAILAIALVTES